MKALILAGGRGKRLRPLTDKIPKSLIPIKKKPLIQYTINYLKKFGINEIIVCSGYKSKQIECYIKKNKNFGCKIEYSTEKTSLGTGGAIKNAIKKNPNDIAAIIIEPIQGEGGDNFFRNDFFTLLRNISDENNILLIFDEVQTGIGITGKMWAHQHYDARPDIICFAKKTQVGGILAGKRIDEIEDNVFSESSRINSTFGGNLVDMIRFKIILETIREEKLLKNSKDVGKYLLTRLKNLEKKYPAYMTNSRGLGLWAAFDLPSITESQSSKFLKAEVYEPLYSAKDRINPSLSSIACLKS